MDHKRSSEIPYTKARRRTAESRRQTQEKEEKSCKRNKSIFSSLSVAIISSIRAHKMYFFIYAPRRAQKNRERVREREKEGE